jgi:hypothetical protein
VSREAEIAALLQADAALEAVLTGGIYVYGELGREGITQDSCPDCFDSDGYLLPCAIVKQRGEIPTFEAGDMERQETSANVVVEIYIYEDVTYTAIDAAKPLIYRLLQGNDRIFADSYEIYLANTLSRQRDTGALQDASMERVDYVVPFMMAPA